MKKLTKAVLALIVVASSFTACKKGEGDPSISFRSRAARVAGEWTVDSQEMKSDFTNTSTGSGFSYSSNSTEKFTPTTYSGTVTNTSSGSITTETSTGTVSENSWTFDKEGTYTHKLNYTVKKTTTETDSQFGFTITTIEDVTTVTKNSEEGVWNFLGKVQADTKNKEEMTVSGTKMDNMVVTTTIYTVKVSGFSDEVTTTVRTETNSDNYEPNENVAVWKITTLKNKEMIVEAAGKTTGSSSIGTITTTSTGTTNTSSGSTSTGSYSANISFIQE